MQQLPKHDEITLTLKGEGGDHYRAVAHNQRNGMLGDARFTWPTAKIVTGPESGGEILKRLPKVMEIIHNRLWEGGKEFICLRLCFENAASLEELPWEALRLGKPGHEAVYIQPAGVAVLRGSANAKPKVKQLTTEPIRILVFVSTPNNLESLYPRAETDRLSEVFHGSDNIEIVDCLGTPDKFIEKINTFQPNILHYIGHSRKTKSTDATMQKYDDGHLLLTRPTEGDDHPLNSEKVMSLLRDLSVKLVFLNSCESAWIARALVGRGIPVAIGMRHKIDDKLAGELSSRFYKSLWETGCPEHALNQAQAEFFVNHHSSLLWASPSLFLKDQTGQLFKIDSRPAQKASHPILDTPPTVANNGATTITGNNNTTVIGDTNTTVTGDDPIVILGHNTAPIIRIKNHTETHY